jgi:hypothetical protein
VVGLENWNEIRQRKKQEQEGEIKRNNDLS